MLPHYYRKLILSIILTYARKPASESLLENSGEGVFVWWCRLDEFWWISWFRNLSSYSLQSCRCWFFFVLFGGVLCPLFSRIQLKNIFIESVFSVYDKKSNFPSFYNSLFEYEWRFQILPREREGTNWTVQLKKFFSQFPL